jgi:hypothetical protein
MPLNPNPEAFSSVKKLETCGLENKAEKVPELIFMEQNLPPLSCGPKVLSS